MTSLKYRIAGTIFLLEAAMLVVVLGYTISSFWQHNVDRLNKEEQIILDMLSEFGRVALLTSDFSGFQAHLERSTDDHILSIVLIDAHDQIVVSSNTSIMENGIATENANDPQAYWKTIDIKNAAGKFGALAIQFSNAQLVALYSQVRNRSIILGVSGMLIIAFVAISAGRLLTRRLDKVTYAANRFALGEKSGVKTNMTGADEIARLAQAFDNMVEDKLHSEENLEKQVQERTAALEASNKELEAFSYSISHDLRTPLRSIDGFSYILLEDHNDQLDSAGQECLQKIRSASQNMGKLIEDILDLSRVGRHEVQFSKVDLSKHAHTILEHLRELSPDRLVDITIEPDIIVQGDEKLLRVVMENLIGNAWKYTSKNENSVIEIGTLNNSTVYVRDNGVGFNMNYADKLFKTFHRLHVTDDFEGTGVGLATVSRIIEKHGGRVWGEGEVNRGATFYFEL